MADLLGMYTCEQETGDHGGEHQRYRREDGSAAPLEVGLRSAWQRDEVIGNGKCRDEETSEADLLKDRCDDDAEKGHAPRGKWRLEELFDGKPLWRRSEVSDELHHEAEHQAESYQLGRVDT